MFPQKILVIAPILAAALAFGQQPPVKVNILNVCTPSAEDQKALTAALAKVSGKPAFGADYEVARGRSTIDQGTAIPGMGSLPLSASSTAKWVRVRREFPSSALFSNAQYSFSVDEKNMVETLVLHLRDTKDVMQISIEDSASAVVSAATMLAANTPVSRVKLERFGKSSIVLARCPGGEGTPPPDQSAYEPIFHTASSIMLSYRTVLDVSRMVPAELARLGPGMAAKASTPKKKSP